MRVQVVRLESGESGLRAALKTSGGVVWAYWRGEPPTRGVFTDVELAVTRVLDWGRELQPLTQETGQTAPLEVLDVTLVGVGADGSAELRVGDGILHVATNGAPPPLGTKLRLQKVELTAYPTE